MNAVARIAVLRALPGLGDLLCVVPALRTLRAGAPHAEITFIGLSSTRWFADRFGTYVDRFVTLESWPGLPEAAGRPEAARGFVEAMRAQRFDVALQLHGDGSVTNELIVRLGARRTAGLAAPTAYRPDVATFPEPPDGSEVERALAPLRALGLACTDRRLEWPERAGDEATMRGALGSIVDRPFVVVHAGASLLSRRWSPTGFGIVADALAAQGLQPVLTGVAAESDVTRAVRAAMTAPAIDMTGAFGLAAMAALVRRARLVVTNDTGISHLAAAVATPSVVVFCVTEPRRWKPEGASHVAVRAGPSVAVTANEVLAAADDLLSVAHR